MDGEMSNDKDRAEAQAQSFRTATIGSVIANNTLGGTTPLPKQISRTGGLFRVGLGLLRDYLRRRRAKTRAKRVDRLRQALVSAGVTEMQSESSQRLSVIEGRLEQVLLTMETLRARVDALLSRNVIQLSDERVAVRTPYGYVICPQSEYHLIIYLSEGGAHEPGTCRVLESLIVPGDHVIDVGAQVGLLTLVMGRAVGTSGSVLAIEASQVLADCIRRTLSTNGLLEHCRVLQTAVSDKAGTATFHLAERSGHSSLFPLSEESREVEVQISPLDDLVSSQDRISLIKVDVEGAELQVLHGMSRILEENPEVLLLVEFGPSHLARVGQTITHWLGEFRDLGFDYILEIDEDLAICRPVRSETELSKAHSLNLIFARSGSSRIARIPQS
jgi:FkbM family methyltransferase